MRPLPVDFSPPGARLVGAGAIGTDSPRPDAAPIEEIA
jgi:hypothetical protein